MNRKLVYMVLLGVNHGGGKLAISNSFCSIFFYFLILVIVDGRYITICM